MQRSIVNYLSIIGGKACAVTSYNGVRHDRCVLQDGWVGQLDHHALTPIPFSGPFDQVGVDVIQ